MPSSSEEVQTSAGSAPGLELPLHLFARLPGQRAVMSARRRPTHHLD